MCISLPSQMAANCTRGNQGGSLICTNRKYFDRFGRFRVFPPKKLYTKYEVVYRPKIPPFVIPTTVFYWRAQNYRVRHDQIVAQLVGRL